MRKRTAILYLGLLVLAPAIWAGKHPVPLDAKADATQCVTCHEDKTKGKAVHSAIAMGCLSCHEVRVNRDVTRVKLITATPVKLCVQCHADRDASQIKGIVHQPAVRDCLSCHDPHNSDNKNQLKKATSGDAKDNLCSSCHRNGKRKLPQGGSVHAAVEMGCDTCHTTHKTGDPSKREFSSHLNKAPPQLCFDCHDIKDAALAKAHQNQPIETSDCITCHDPHDSDSPKLLQKFAHAPFASGSCDTCHAAPKDGKVVLTQADAKTLCLSCHDEKGKQIESAKVQHPGAAGDCTDCHNPHAGKSPAFPKPDAVSVCLGCHSEQAEQHSKRVLHQPAFKQGCATCHEPHGGDNAKLLRAATAAGVCLECHSPERAPAKAEADHLVTIFKGKVRLPEDYFDATPVLPLKYGLGHPVDRHPVADAPDPNNPNKKMSMNCMSCHQPHSSAQPNLLVKDQSNNMAFCNTCHQPKKAEAGDVAPAAPAPKSEAAGAPSRKSK